GRRRLRRLLGPLFVGFNDESIDAGLVKSQLLSIGRPGRIKAILGRALGQAPQTAAIEVDGPDFVTAAAVRIERDSPSVRRPARHAIAAAAVGHLAWSGTVPSGDEEVFLRAAESVISQPLPVRRKLRRRHTALAGGNRRQRANNGALLWVELDALNILFDNIVDISQPLTVARKARVPAFRPRPHHRLALA